MLKKFSFYILFFFLAIGSAEATIKTDSLLSILKIKEKNVREKAFIKYLRFYLQDSEANNLSSAKAELNDFLTKYNVENKKAYAFFIESAYQRRLSHMNESEIAMINAIHAASKNDDDYLTFTFLSFLAYMQTEDGNVIGAVSSYRMAKKEAVKLKDTNLQMLIDINISDVYYKNNFYSLSLFYLNQAQAIGANFWPDDQRIKNIIYYNKAENFFRMNSLDSLGVYNKKLKRSKANTYKLYTFKNRTDYYLFLLRHDYGNAIKRIHAMQNDEGYMFDDQDLQNLSDAYYKNGQPDSAKSIINLLLSKPSEINHPEIKFHLYNVLGEIAEQEGDYKTASANFKLSLQQTEDNINRLTQVDNISSLIKVDEIEGYYTQKGETYKTERMWLIFAVIFVLLVVLVIAMFYRTIKQKRHYEKLLYIAKRAEISYINSHDVRKHLTNILGLIEVIKHSEHKEQEYFNAEEHLFCSAKSLDEAIKNISKKLDD